MSQVRIAKAIATVAHRGQVDKSGQPYIEHPKRVARIVGDLEYAFSDVREKFVAAAWLHDVLEDTDIEPGDLEEAGVDPEVISAVVRLSKTKGFPNADYYEVVRESQMAKTVKLADIEDNLNAVRLSKLDDQTIVRLVKKYAKALEALDA